MTSHQNQDTDIIAYVAVLLGWREFGSSHGAYQIKLENRKSNTFHIILVSERIFKNTVVGDRFLFRQGKGWIGPIK